MLSQAPNPYNNEPPRPPASRRAASTGGIGLANPSNPSSRSTSQSRWEAGIPLPPPPPGPPPASARSQSLNRTNSPESSGQAQGLASRARDPHVRGTALGPVPPTPADWREESPAPRRRDESMERPQLMQPLHVDTGCAVQHSAMSTDESFSAVPGSAERRASGQHARRDSSTSALFRTSAVRNRSAKGIRERRSESRNGRERIVEPLSAAPKDGLVNSPENVGPSKPTDLNLHKDGNLLTRRMISKRSPRSGNTNPALDGPLSPRSPFGAVQGRFVSLQTPPQPDSARSHTSVQSSTPTPPFSPGSSQFASPSSHSVQPQTTSPKALPTPPIQNAAPTRSLLAPRTTSQERPISHLLHIPNATASLQQPLVPLASPPEELVVDLLGPETSDTFCRSSIDRHRAFAEREAAASTDAERLALFIQYVSEETNIRREQYAAVLQDKDINVDNILHTLFPTPGTAAESEAIEDVVDDGDADSMHGSIATESSSDDLLCRVDSTATGKNKESPITDSSMNSPQYRPESSHWAKEYQPCLSPIASMSIVTGQDEENSRGRAPSRWWEDPSEGGTHDDRFNVLGRSKRESKYMGLPKEARNSPAFFDNVPASSSSSQYPQASSSHRQSTPTAHDYPPEKVGWHEESVGLPPPPAHPPTPLSAPLMPGTRKLDISRLVTLPPPYPRHHPAVNNNHPDLTDERAIVHSLNNSSEASTIRSSYESSVKARRQRAESWAKHQRSIHDQDMQFRIDHGEMTEADFDRAEEDLEKRLLKSEKEVTQTDFDTFQSQVVTPLHALFTSRIETATLALTKLSSHLFDSAQSHSPNQPQEEGDDSAELLEKLTMLKWLFEAREALHRETYNLLSERNDKYKAIVTLPYKATKNTQKQAEAEAFFARDARERQIAHDQAVSSRMEAFLKVIEGNVTRGVEIQLSAFWDIAPGILQLVHKIPGDRRVSSSFSAASSSSSPRRQQQQRQRQRQEDLMFSIDVPSEEFEDNPSYHTHPLQYLYTLLTHAEKSTYQFIESQTNLFCLLHEIRYAAMNARIRAELAPPPPSSSSSSSGGERDDETREYWEREIRQRKAVEERSLTEDLKEKVGVVEAQWEGGLGGEVRSVKGRVRGWLVEEGGWDEELEDGGGGGGAAAGGN